MCVFAPFFKSEMKGPSKDKQSKACITYGFDKPTKDNWLTSVLVETQEAQDIYKIHVETQRMVQKSIKKINKKVKKKNILMDDHVYMTEEDDIEKLKGELKVWEMGH